MISFPAMWRCPSHAFCLDSTYLYTLVHPHIASLHPLTSDYFWITQNMYHHWHRKTYLSRISHCISSFLRIWYHPTTLIFLLHVFDRLSIDRYIFLHWQTDTRLGRQLCRFSILQSKYRRSHDAGYLCLQPYYFEIAHYKNLNLERITFRIRIDCHFSTVRSSNSSDKVRLELK